MTLMPHLSLDRFMNVVLLAPYAKDEDFSMLVPLTVLYALR